MSLGTPRQEPLSHRIDEFYRRLRLLPRATSGEMALQQLCQTLEQVEDDLSGIEKKSPSPPPNNPDGRMYCPQEDHIIRHSDGSILALTRGPRLEIAADGAVRIVNKVTLQLEFER